jgi:hypothetical protein
LREATNIERGGFHSALSRAFHVEGSSCNRISSNPTRRKFKPTYFARYYGATDVKKKNVTVPQNGHVILIGEKRRKLILRGSGITLLDGKRYIPQAERRIELS